MGESKFTLVQPKPLAFKKQIGRMKGSTAHFPKTPSELPLSQQPDSNYTRNTLQSQSKTTQFAGHPSSQCDTHFGTSTGSTVMAPPVRPPRRRPVQVPSQNHMLSGAAVAPTHHQTNPYIPNQTFSSTHPTSGSPCVDHASNGHIERSSGRRIDHQQAALAEDPVHSFTQSTHAIQLFPDDQTRARRLDSPRVNDIETENSVVLPKILLIPPPTPEDINNRAERPGEVDDKLSNAEIISSSQINPVNNPEFSREVAELLMGWTPWAYSTLGNHSNEKMQDTQEQDDQLRKRSSSTDCTSASDSSYVHVSGESFTPYDSPNPAIVRPSFRSRLQRFNIFEPSHPNKGRKLRKPRPRSRFQSKRKGSTGLIITVLPESREDAEALVKATYSHVISKTLGVDAFDFQPTRPRLISLTSAQAQKVEREMSIGIAR